MKAPPNVLRSCLSLALALLLGACSALGFRSGPHTPAEAQEAFERGQALSDAGRMGEALRSLSKASAVEGLDPGLRSSIDTLLEKVAVARIAELEAQTGGASELEDISEMQVPGHIAVQAGVSSATKYLDADRPYKCYRVLRDLEQRFPNHYERRAAGELAVTSGLRMASQSSHFLGLFTLRDEGLEALEWLVVMYPSEPRCDEAYFRLGELYAGRRYFDVSAQRYEDLVAYHLHSPLAVEAEARIPRMRLAGLESPEYDRRELLRARTELEAWLQRHSDSESAQRVREDHADCLRRLVLSDQVIARFYRRIGRPYGLRVHATRALDTARQCGEPDLIESSQRLLAQADDLDKRSGATRFLDAPEAPTPSESDLQQPAARESEDGSGQP